MQVSSRPKNTLLLTPHLARPIFGDTQSDEKRMQPHTEMDGEMWNGYHTWANPRPIVSNSAKRCCCYSSIIIGRNVRRLRENTGSQRIFYHHWCILLNQWFPRLTRSRSSGRVATPSSICRTVRGEARGGIVPPHLPKQAKSENIFHGGPCGAIII